MDGKLKMPRNSISILIPTRDRAELLASAIKSCLSQKYDNCTFIVSDNASIDHTREVVSGFRDPRLRYLNTGSRLSMADNFEYALSHALPGYVLSIGDDDALMPDALEYLDALIDETHAEAIGGRWNCYFWGSFPLEAVRNNLYLWLGQGFSVKTSSVEVRRALHFNYSYTHKLAGLYYGLISTKLVDRLRSRGKFFHSVTPDAYSAFACSLASESYVFSHKPFVLAGQSGKSNGASQLLNVDSSEASKFLAENTHAFNKSLVYCPAESIIMADAFLQLGSVHPDLTQDFPLSISRVCAMAIRNASPNVRAPIEAATRQIALMHDIDFAKVRRLSKIPAIGALIRKELDELRYPHFLVRCDTERVGDIAAAAQYAVCVTEDRQRIPFQTWAAYQLLRISRRLGRAGFTM
jgi:glycosyltransferase involved in cell wall biosynthesis